MSTIMDVLDNRDFIKVFAALNMIWVAARGGAALGMYVFSVPTIIAGQDSSTLVMLRQFHHLITLGARYLQTDSQIHILGVLTAFTWLLYRHPDQDISSCWLAFFTSVVIQVQVAWYEIVFVFPINDTLVKMEGRLEKMDEDADRAMRPEVLKLFEKWRTWHTGRIIMPLLGAVVLIGGLPMRLSC